MEGPAHEFEYELTNGKFVRFETYEQAKAYAHGHKEIIDYALLGGILFSVYHKIPFTSRQRYDNFVNKFPEQYHPLVRFLLGRFHRSPENKNGNDFF
jgi:hypothetical protein